MVGLCYDGSSGSGMWGYELAKDRDGWWALVNAVMNIQGSIKCGEFLD
jgi:hypothetical protein